MAKTDLKKKFGTVVRDRRAQLGMSQEDLAERAELHRTYVSDIERGARNVSLQSIGKLASALDISVSALFPEEVQIGKTGAAQSAERRDRKLVDVLLVEDNPDDVEMTLHAFKRARFANHVHVVRDGAAALDYLFCRGRYSARPAGKNPELILLDLDLPKVSGVEVLRCIKADKRTAQIPVAILTVSDDISVITECRRLGSEQYIIKPVDFQRLSLVTPQLNLEWALCRRAASQSIQI